MKTVEEVILEKIVEAGKASGFEMKDAVVMPCAMQNMGDYQCNEALRLAKVYHKSPIEIANAIKNNLVGDGVISSCEVAGAGYLNIFVDDNFLSTYLKEYVENLGGLYKDNAPLKTIIDYGGANVAKPLHVGHLRTADIGESIKRIVKLAGNETLGDVHLGDWGLQMGMVISEIKRRQPDLVYFDDNYKGEYPKESPITIKDLETLYPEASAKAKNDEKLMEEAKQATFDLQHGKRGYLALFRHILNISKADLKKNYDALNVNFDLWLGESDVNDYCKVVIDEIKNKGLAYKSEGALVVDISNPDDKNELPPFMLEKSDGAVLYSTTDLATIYQRDREFNAKRIIYVVDNRQALHFTQLFRCAEKTGITKNKIKYDFVGFGTMNGKDGKPYKTRDGGVMQLATLIDEVKSKAMEKILQAKGGSISYTKDEMKDISNKVAISALKFADLSVFRTKDFNFDPDKFCSFDGKTGPYILYTITRAKSILKKAGKLAGTLDASVCDRKLINLLIAFKNEFAKSYEELAPSYLCDYVYRIANEFNTFYASCNIINEQDEIKKQSWLTLTQLVLTVMEKVMKLLGIETLDKM